VVLAAVMDSRAPTMALRAGFQRQSLDEITRFRALLRRMHVETVSAVTKNH
jgi:hypothetical protein